MRKVTNLIPDINLKSVINQYLSRPEDTDITKSDLESINGYICSDISSMGKYICNIEGLQYAINMHQLLIENNLITSMENLINLDKLNTLFLNNNLISTVPNLANMTNLNSLHRLPVERTLDLLKLTKIEFVIYLHCPL